MKPEHRLLLAVDAVVNLALGLALLLSPVGTLTMVGLPPSNTFFYVTILVGSICFIGAPSSPAVPLPPW